MWCHYIMNIGIISEQLPLYNDTLTAKTVFFIVSRKHPCPGAGRGDWGRRRSGVSMGLQCRKKLPIAAAVQGLWLPSKDVVLQLCQNHSHEAPCSSCFAAPRQ